MEIRDLKALAVTPAFHAEMKEVFFEAMNAGYANNAKKKSVLWLPGSKTIEYKRGSWRIVDTYHVTPLSSVSGGTTIISYEETPVWIMQYFGKYDEEAIPCLKAALREAYREKKFYGGRGPYDFVHKGFAYRNWIRNDTQFRSSLDLFMGAEEIHDANGRLRGKNRFHGGIMC